MTITTTKLHPVIGAEVHGFDFLAPMDEGTLTALKDAFATHHILLFRGVDITDAQHVSFSRHFSDLESFPQSNMGAATVPEIYLVSNVDTDGQILNVESDTARFQSLTQLWHTDSSYLPTPSLGAVLRGLEVTSDGGETQFSNMFAAYEALSDDMKEKIAPLKARHSFQYSRALKNQPPMKAEELAKVPPVDQPIVRVHPNGRRSLYFSAPMMEGVVGWSVEDSKALFAYLLDHISQPEFVYKHKWSRHDLVMWDNRCTMHCVTPYAAATERRIMHRTALVGTELVVGI